MSTINNLLKAKGHNVWTIEPEASTFDALHLMAEKDIGALLVMSKGKLVGIFSERDYARKVVLKGRTSKDTPVGDLMNKMVYYINPESTIEECMKLMSDKRIRHLPVLDNGELVGVVTIGDIVNRIISEQKQTIDDLEDYITGAYGAENV